MPKAGASHIGPYELRGELGRGAMARVWRAWDTVDQRDVAIKEPLFDPRLPQETLDEMARRFVVEGRASALLKHPNIVAIYATDVWDGRPAIVMELVEGMTLTNLLATAPPTFEEALSFLDQLLDAVSFAHGHGVVHRDIKPDNIFITRTGQVKLADFGIAHVEVEGATRLTMAGSVLGTPGYMSPEQVQGRPADARSDLFSIGVVAYEMFTGENPFDVGSPNATTLMYRVVHEAVPDLQMRLPGMPECVARTVMAALAKSPDERPASAEAFKRMLHGVSGRDGASIETVVSTEPGKGRWPNEGAGTAFWPHESATSETRKSWLPYALVAAACIAALVLALASTTTGSGGGGSRMAVPNAETSGGVGLDAQDVGMNALEPAEKALDSTTNDAGEAEESQSFSQQDPPYTLTVDANGLLCLFDASGRRMADQAGFYLEVSYLPEKAVARLEQGVTYGTYDEAWAEYSSTDDDCVPPVASGQIMASRPNLVADDGPYWCIVIDTYASRDEAERVAAASASQFGTDASVLSALEWYGLFYEYLYDGDANHSDEYCVVTGLARTYQEVLQNYLALSEVIGRKLDAREVEEITSSASSWRLLDELSEIKYVGTRRYLG